MLRLLAAAALLCGCAGVAPPQDPQTPLGRVLAAARAGGDEGFAALLSGRGLRPDLPAPEALRALLLWRPVNRLRLDLVWRREGGKQSVSWRLGETGWPGAPEEVSGRLRDLLGSQGFNSRETAGGFSFAAAGGGVSQSVDVRGPFPWSGRPDYSGLRLRWSAWTAESSGLAVLADALTQWPVLLEPRVEDALIEALSPLPVCEVCVGAGDGGAGSWEASFPPNPEEGPATLRAMLQGLLAKSGFAPAGREGQADLLRRRDSGSMVRLYDPDAAGRVRLAWSAGR
ncbi:MAG: hypothetical protein PHF00_05040 [Elusimicrobia bacterium]|nr:hypothetical protein [Elusimicrobiota bacterium]